MDPELKRRVERLGSVLGTGVAALAIMFAASWGVAVFYSLVQWWLRIMGRNP